MSQIAEKCSLATRTFAETDLHFRLDFCAECLDSFIRDSLGRTEADDKLPLGFTVSSLDLDRSDGIGISFCKANSCSFCQFSYPCSYVARYL